MTRRWNFLGGLFPALLLMLAASVNSRAFSLLGPYASWMTTTNGYRQWNTIGGPMNIGQGYRWNVPKITYAFDQSFLDFFGSHGVDAVEQALGILNRLTNASQIVVSNFARSTQGMNEWVEPANQYDLKSTALALLLEQMGLDSPSKNVVVSGITNEERRNFDPFTFAPSSLVNGIYYGGPYQQGEIPWQLVWPENPFAPSYYAVTEYAYQYAYPGQYFNGLTRDDAGGLKYLLRSNTINYEILLPDVHGYLPPKPEPPPVPPFGSTRQPPPPAPSSPISHPFVNAARRPGVEKITFVRHPYNARLGKSSPLTYQFHDTYITNGVAIHQILERTVREPDILFSAKFLPVEAPMYEGTMYERTGTSNWWSGAAGSANPNRTGPGIIRPPIKIAFKKTGRAFLTDDGPGSGVDFSFRIASFSSTASPIISYPQAAGHLDTNHLTINLWIESNYAENGVFNKQDFTWRLPIGIGKLAAAQASTNLVDWDPLFTVVNQGETLLWYHLRTTPVRFLRVVAQ